MLFNSNVFIFGFLPIVLILFHICGQISSRCAIALLALASLVFYAWDSISMLPILILSITLNYIYGQYLCAHTIRFGCVTPRILIICGITANLAVLSLYKYTNLLIEIVNQIIVLWGQKAIPQVEIYLPTGISFFTFTQIAYLIDCYRNRVPERNPVDYTLFVSLFPHLIAGPLLHHRNIISQLSNIVEASRNVETVSIGIAIFSIGLVKKY
jgi:alginate O-acetyltransferase complex protein AlgI